MSNRKQEQSVAKPAAKPTNPKDVINQVLPTRYRLKCKNHKQKDFANMITENDIVVAYGPAGVGKTYVAVARAIELLQNKTSSINKIVVVSPTITVEKDLGFLPGDLREKLEPHIGAVISQFHKIIGVQKTTELEALGILEFAPFAFIRGKTYENTILLLEEAQNTSPHQMKTLLTRIGVGSKYVLSGDLDQSDRFKSIKESGLYDVIKKLKGMSNYGEVEFVPTREELVRHPLLYDILERYKEKEEPIKTIRVQEVKKKTEPPKPIKVTKESWWSRLIKRFRW